MNTPYFILIGWWFGLLWLGLSLAIAATIVLWPVGMAMAYRTPDVMFGET